MSLSIDSTGRPVLPSPTEIAKLPPDGGGNYNRLIFEKSPYLLQHAANPVDWWPWGEAAFREARKRDRPVFLSIGYATCHWCHVMEHESFEDEGIAKLINDHFVAIKVDREERPELDEVYMKVTEAMTGSGGWPMTVILTPDQHPFFAGTYFPRDSSTGRPGLRQILEAVNLAWKERRQEIETSARGIVSELNKMLSNTPGGALDTTVLDKARVQFGLRFDKEKGGFSIRPKFPTPSNLQFLLRHHRRTSDAESLAMVEKTLGEIRRGGIWDHIGYGIHRYSTDREWLVPHFEKMLYDQAIYARANLDAYQVTGEDPYARSARETLSYVLRDLTSEEGGFYSAEDADSEGVEGKFYTWSLAEILAVLGAEDGKWFADHFQISEAGNYHDEFSGQLQGLNIPHLASDLSAADHARLEPLRIKLWQYREKRIHPLKDDKILTDWNGLMISAFAKAAQVLGDKDYGSAAIRAAEFLLTHLRASEDRLWKRYRQGEAGLTAHLEDYAFVIAAMLDLYETDFDPRWLEQAIIFQKTIDRFFWDTKDGGYFTVAEDSEPLIVRAKKLYGGALPSGNSVCMANLTRLYHMTGDTDYAKRCDTLIRAFSGEIAEQAFAYSETLCSLDLVFGPTQEVVIAGEMAQADTQAMLTALRRDFRPQMTVLLRSSETAEALAKLAPFTEAQKPHGGKATAYVCRDFSCLAPVTEVVKMIDALKAD